MLNILNGTDAIDWFELHGVGILSKRTDPTEEARAGITVSEARAIAREDAGLIALHVPVADVRRIVVDWENNAETWWDAFHQAADARTAPGLILQDIAAELSDAATDELLLPTVWADRFMAWAATLPGFANGPDHARNALLCQDIG